MDWKKNKEGIRRWKQNRRIVFAILALIAIVVFKLGYIEKCDFYIPVKELGYAVVGIKHLHKYRQLQNDYEARVKADLVAMLEELKKEIIELPFPQREPEYMQGYSYCQMNILDYVIQDKIDKLRGEEDENNN